MLGSNVSTVGGLHNCFANGDKWNCKCVQIYTTLSRRWNIKPELDADTIKNFEIAKFNSSVSEVISHVPFLVNLCSDNAELRIKSIDRLYTELIYNNQLNIKYMVLHPGSNINKGEGIKMIADALNIALAKISNNKCNILLETMSGQGNMIGGKFEDIHKIINLVSNSEFLGVCLDTAHIFQAGYNIWTDEGYKSVFALFNEVIGIEKIKVIHLNDSKEDLYSKKDRHDFIGEGKIGLNFFKNLLSDSRFVNIPKILELPDINRSFEAMRILDDL